MNKSTLLEKAKPQKIGKAPVVVLPLRDWEKMKSILEEYEILRSQRYIKSIAEARKQVKEGKVYQLDLKTGKLKKVKNV